jgi:hypothetical protein
MEGGGEVGRRTRGEIEAMCTLLCQMLHSHKGWDIIDPLCGNFRGALQAACLNYIRISTFPCHATPQLN